MLSCIVTIYNKDSYLERCLQSMTGTKMDAEFILVDDGSTDGSERICDDYAGKDPRIAVIHKPNGGASSARYTGIEAAHGEYVLFIDADDWVDGDILETLLSKLGQTNADIITGGWIIHDGDSLIEENGYMPEGIYKEGDNKSFFASHMIYCDGLDRNGINGSLNTKIIKLELLRSIFMEMPEGIVYAEDDFVAYACLAKAKSVEVTHLPFYHYEMHYDSVSHSRIDSFLRDLERGYHFYIDAIKDSPDYLLYKRQSEIFVQRAMYLGSEKYLGFEKDSVASWYRCDTGDMPEGSVIVLYGAGKVGKCFYRHLTSDNRYSVASWVDKEYQVYRKEGYHVDPPQIISDIESDYIVIAVDDEKKAALISDSLEKEYGVSKDRIYWRKPINLVDEALNESMALGELA